MHNKLYSSAQRDLVFDWCERWLELIDLITEVTGTPEPPTNLDELKYCSIRLWFIDHQAQFVPLWEEFYERQEWASHQYYSAQDIEDIEDVHKYFKNPFFYFYEPENLYRLAQQLDLQGGVDVWEPSEYRASVIRPILIRFGEIVIEFMDWVSERAYDSG